MCNPSLFSTDSMDPDFRRLAAELEQELYIRDGDTADAQAELNRIEYLPVVIVAYCGQEAVACGGYQVYEPGVVELKRMYVKPAFRRHRIATAILQALESLAGREKYHTVLLETGRNQPEAVCLYEERGYTRISRFGKYRQNPNSVCLGKVLRTGGRKADDPARP
ncbi:MAG TPA: GNAT family N-acetyltransferase [Chitinophagaceae bacterium]|nr:GNAT family N-acetyltransferase [Chitinophagaceae bacterium]